MAVNTVNNASHAYFQLFSGISIHYDPERFSKIRFVFPTRSTGAFRKQNRRISLGSALLDNKATTPY